MEETQVFLTQVKCIGSSAKRNQHGKSADVSRAPALNAPLFARLASIQAHRFCLVVRTFAEPAAGMSSDFE
jgi:hypothetical protein